MPNDAIGEVERNGFDLEQMFEEAPVGIVFSSFDGRILKANRAFLELMGYTADDLAARTTRDLTYGEDVARDAILLEELRAGLIPLAQREKRCVRGDGSLVWVLLSTVVARRDGTPLHFVTHLQDITSRKQAEARLREDDELYHTLARNLPELAIFVYDSELRYRLVEGAALEQCGWPRELLLGARLEELAPAPLFPLWKERMLAALQEKQIFEAHPSPGQILSVTAVPLRTGERGANGLAIVRDITQERDTLAMVTRQASLLDLAHDAIMVCDLEHRIVFWNKGAERLYGWGEEEAIGRPSYELLQTRTKKPMAELVQQLIEQEHWEGESVQVTRDGRELHLASRWTLRRAPDGTPLDILKINADVTQHWQAERARREAEARFLSAFQAAPIGMALVAPDGRWISVNESLCRIVGYSVAELLQTTFQQLTHPDDLEADLAQVQQLLDGRIDAYRMEKRYIHKRGHLVWVVLSVTLVRDEAGHPLHFISQVEDIMERKAAEERLTDLALHDTLTGLANRRLLVDRTTLALARFQRTGQPPAVLYMDLDRFKNVNDSLGHPVGDKLLVEVARRLQAAVRPADTVARIGGDEFVILAEDLTSPADADALATRVEAVLAEPIDVGPQQLFASVSIGIATARPEDSADTLLRNADAALYRAKEQGRARHEIFDEAMRARAIERLEIENALRGATERQEFRVFFQPIVSLATRRLLGFEALVRWMHPRRGLLAPGAFISIAEETGLILPIGNWVLEESCRQAQRWPTTADGTPLYVSVNIAARQLLHPTTPEVVSQVLQRTGFDPARLCLEITESALIEPSGSSARCIERLRNLGLRIAIDDFGTGYASLSYVHRFHVDVLKVDKSFVDDLLDHPNNGAIVRSAVSMGHELGLQIIAEGVEAPLQVERLAALKCDAGQGYLFGKPMPAEQVEAFRAQWQREHPL